MHVCKASDAPGLAEKMLGEILVTKQARGGVGVSGRGRTNGEDTKPRCAALPPDASPAHPPSHPHPPPPPPPRTPQTGPKGKPVNTLYVANRMQLKREMYFAILLDRKSAGPMMIGCR